MKFLIVILCCISFCFSDSVYTTKKTEKTEKCTAYVKKFKRSPDWNFEEKDSTVTFVWNNVNPKEWIPFYSTTINADFYVKCDIKGNVIKTYMRNRHAIKD